MPRSDIKYGHLMQGLGVICPVLIDPSGIWEVASRIFSFANERSRGTSLGR